MKKGSTGIISVLVVTLIVIGGFYFMGKTEFSLHDYFECTENRECRSGFCEQQQEVMSTADVDCLLNGKAYCPYKFGDMDVSRCEVKVACNPRFVTPSFFTLNPGQSIYEGKCLDGSYDVCSSTIYHKKGICKPLGECNKGDYEIRDENCELSDNKNCIGTRKVKYHCTEDHIYESVGIPITQCVKKDKCCGVDCGLTVKSCGDFCSSGKLCEYPKEEVTGFGMCVGGFCVSDDELSCGEASCKTVFGQCSAVCDSNNPCQSIKKNCEDFCMIETKQWCSYTRSQGNCIPGCISGACGTCEPNCGDFECEYAVGKCGYGNIFVSSDSPYSVVDDVVVNVQIDDMSGSVSGVLEDEYGSSIQKSCWLFNGECDLNFGKQDFGVYSLEVFKSGLRKSTQLEVWRQIVVESFGPSRQSGNVEVEFLVKDDSGMVLENYELDDVEIKVLDHGVTRRLGNDNIDYVGYTGSGGAVSGNFKVSYSTNEYGKIKFIATFRKNGYFDGKAEKEVIVETSKMNIPSDDVLQHAVMNEDKFIEFSVKDSNQFVDVETMRIEIVDSNGNTRDNLDLSDVKTSMKGRYSFTYKFDMKEKWSLNVFAEKRGYEPLNRLISVSVAEDKPPATDWLFIVMVVAAAIVVVYFLFKIVRRLRG